MTHRMRRFSCHVLVVRAGQATLVYVLVAELGLGKESAKNLLHVSAFRATNYY